MQLTHNCFNHNHHLFRIYSNQRKGQHKRQFVKSEDIFLLILAVVVCYGAYHDSGTESLVGAIVWTTISVYFAGISELTVEGDIVRVSDTRFLGLWRRTIQCQKSEIKFSVLDIRQACCCRTPSVFLVIRRHQPNAQDEIAFFISPTTTFCLFSLFYCRTWNAWHSVLSEINTVLQFKTHNLLDPVPGDDVYGNLQDQMNQALTDAATMESFRFGYPPHSRPRNVRIGTTNGCCAVSLPTVS